MVPHVHHGKENGENDLTKTEVVEKARISINLKDSTDSSPRSSIGHVLLRVPTTSHDVDEGAVACLYLTTTHTINNTTLGLSEFEVDFEDGDPTNPLNWPTWYKSCTIGAVSFATWVVVLFSTNFTSGIAGMMNGFDESDRTIVTLGITTYLLGLAVGSLIVAPLSEIWGRRLLYASALAVFCIFVLPCALAKNLATILVLRFLAYVTTPR